MSQIINGSFAPGERYQGPVNGEIFEVDSVQEAGTYWNEKWECHYVVPTTLIHFRAIRSGRVFRTPLNTANRLLLTRIA